MRTPNAIRIDRETSLNSGRTSRIAMSVPPAVHQNVGRFSEIGENPEPPQLAVPRAGICLMVATSTANIRRPMASAVSAATPIHRCARGPARLGSARVRRRTHQSRHRLPCNLTNLRHVIGRPGTDRHLTPYLRSGRWPPKLRGPARNYSRRCACRRCNAADRFGALREGAFLAPFDQAQSGSSPATGSPRRQIHWSTASMCQP